MIFRPIAMPAGLVPRPWALQAAHAAQYPDPQYTDLRAQLAAFHGVAVERMLMAAAAAS
jgi:histidinol-phosphate/aromatic aminotransferase/cobyric acid decarboxylase-like protein